MREILIMWSAYARPATCPYSLWGGGGSPEAARQREENAIICWRKIAQGFWSTSVFFFLAGNRMTIVALKKEVSLKA